MNADGLDRVVGQGPVTGQGPDRGSQPTEVEVESDGDAGVAADEPGDSDDAQAEGGSTDGGIVASEQTAGTGSDTLGSMSGSNDDGVEIDLGLDDEPPVPAEQEEPVVAQASAGESRDGLVDELERRIEEMSAELEKTKNQLLRVAADFENYRKRMQRQIVDVENRAAEKVLVEILPVMDSLVLAVEHAEGSGEGASLAEGVELVVKQFSSILSKLGVEPIEALGRPFDPAVHEAMQQEESSEVAPGTVVKEWQRGYRVGERLLRPSMVVVSSAPTRSTDEVETSDESGTPTGPNGSSEGQGVSLESEEHGAGDAFADNAQEPEKSPGRDGDDSGSGDEAEVGQETSAENGPGKES